MKQGQKEMKTGIFVFMSKSYFKERPHLTKNNCFIPVCINMGQSFLFWQLLTSFLAMKKFQPTFLTYFRLCNKHLT
jgi:hypothetical protein